MLMPCLGMFLQNVLPLLYSEMLSGKKQSLGDWADGWLVKFCDVLSVACKIVYFFVFLPTN